ncbi:MAG: methyltransferase [Planctomycetota bacterium]
MAEVVLAERWPPRLRALELGCGLGLAGLAALACGMRVTFSDYSPAALAVAAHNARANGFTEFAVLELDWRSPPPEQFPLVLGADVLYEKRCLPQILHVLATMLAPGGVALLTDPFRVNAEPFAELARQRGFAVHSRSHATRETGAARAKGRVYRLTRDREHHTARDSRGRLS